MLKCTQTIFCAVENIFNTPLIFSSHLIFSISSLLSFLKSRSFSLWSLVYKNPKMLNIKFYRLNTKE